MSSPGAVLGKVVHAGEWMEKALVRLSSIRSVSGSFKYHHVKGPQFHTIDAWSDAQGCFALPFVWEGYQLGEAVDQLRYVVEIAGPRLPGLPIKKVDGVFKWRVRWDAVANADAKGLTMLGVDAWQVLRRVKLPSMFTGIATVTPSADLYGLLGYTLVYL